MKEMYRKPAQLTLALIISWIVTYGIVFAKPLCCGATADRCIPAFNRIQVDATLITKCSASLSHRYNLTPPWTAASEILPKDANAGPSCCENDPCGGFNLTAWYYTPSQLCPIAQVKEFGSFHVANGLQNTLNIESQSVLLHPTSIYILTKSIIC